MRKLITVALMLGFVLLTLTAPGLAQPKFEKEINELSTLISQLEGFNAQSKAFLSRLLGNFIDVALFDFTSPNILAKTIEVLKCKLEFLVRLQKNGFLGLNQADQKRIQDALNIIDQIVKSTQLKPDPPSQRVRRGPAEVPLPPVGGCSVRIFFRADDQLIDLTGLKFSAKTGQRLAFEAVAAPVGGAFEWRRPPDAILDTAGEKASYRFDVQGVYRIRVTYTLPDGSQCTDELQVFIYPG